MRTQFGQAEDSGRTNTPFPRRALFVLGFGDEETATVAHVIALRGARAPDPDDRLELAELNAEIATAEGARERELAHRAAGLLMRCAPGTPLILADERLASVLPFWARVCDHAGIASACVVPFADPSDVATRRDEEGTTTTDRLLVWLRRMLDAELATRHLPRVLVPYRLLLRDWRVELGRATEELGLNLPPPTHRQAVAIDRFLTLRVEGGLAAVRTLGPAEGAPTWVARVNEALRGIATSEGPAGAHIAELDRVRSELRDAELARGAGKRLEHLQAALASARAGAEAAEREAAELRSEVATLRARLAQEHAPDHVAVLVESQAAPAPLPPVLPPFPFVVGSPRSGTTLLRGLLDGHPDLAVPPESHFVVGMLTSEDRFQSSGVFACDRFLEELATSAFFQIWQLPVEAVAAELQPEPASLSEALRATYRAYAHHHAKPRYGDKTPPHVAFLDLLAAAFPEAVFIHLIRDGRDVAASLSDAPWGPRDLAGAAERWRERVAAGRAAAGSLGPRRYLEVRYEQLVRDPAQVLEEVCGFAGLEFSPEMLDLGGRAERYVSDALFPSAQRRLRLPISPDLRDWRRDLSVADRAATETVAGPLLAELGYDD